MVFLDIFFSYDKMNFGYLYAKYISTFSVLLAMVEIAKMSERGQIIIPKGIRAAIGVKEGAVFIMMVVDKKILMVPLDRDKIRKDLEDFWNMRRKAKKLSAEEIDRAIHGYRAERRADRGRTRH